eukprot:352677-Chlamydomonas_euryale.AAC.7
MASCVQASWQMRSNHGSEGRPAASAAATSSPPAGRQRWVAARGAAEVYERHRRAAFHSGLFSPSAPYREPHPALYGPAAGAGMFRPHSTPPYPPISHARGIRRARARPAILSARLLAGRLWRHLILALFGVARLAGKGRRTSPTLSSPGTTHLSPQPSGLDNRRAQEPPKRRRATMQAGCAASLGSALRPMQPRASRQGCGAFKLGLRVRAPGTPGAPSLGLPRTSRTVLVKAVSLPPKQLTVKRQLGEGSFG